MTTRPLPEVIERGKAKLSDPQKVAKLRDALTDAIFRLKRAALHSGCDEEFAEVAVSKFRQVLKETE